MREKRGGRESRAWERERAKKEENATVALAFYTCCTNSGFRNEKPMNSVWSRFIMKSLSVGVRSVFSEVNCLSKLLTSLRCCCGKETLKRRLNKKEEERNTYYFWLERGLHFAIFDPLPVDAAEEHVVPDVLFASESAAESFVGVLGEELGLGNFRKVIFIFIRNIKNMLVTCL